MPNGIHLEEDVMPKDTRETLIFEIRANAKLLGDKLRPDFARGYKLATLRHWRDGQLRKLREQAAQERAQEPDGAVATKDAGEILNVLQGDTRKLTQVLDVEAKGPNARVSIYAELEQEYDGKLWHPIYACVRLSSTGVLGQWDLSKRGTGVLVEWVGESRLYPSDHRTIQITGFPFHSERHADQSDPKVTRQAIDGWRHLHDAAGAIAIELMFQAEGADSTSYRQPWYFNTPREGDTMGLLDSFWRVPCEMLHLDDWFYVHPDRDALPPPKVALYPRARRGTA